MRVERVEPSEWNKLAEQAHLICFKELRPARLNTFDYALVCCDDKEIFSYATIIEMDADTAYMQHGGAMPNCLGTTKVLKTYKALIDTLKANYKRISTRIQNTNVAMIKLALSQGLIVVGCDCYPDGVFLHFAYGF